MFVKGEADIPVGRTAETPVPMKKKHLHGLSSAPKPAPRRSLDSGFTALTTGIGITVAFFLAFYLLVNPSYVYTAQQPVFFTTWSFFLDTARYPGGLAAYLGLLFSQYDVTPWLGAAICALIMGAVYTGTGAFLRLLTGKFRIGGALIPFILLLPMHFSYFHPLEFDFKILFLCACGIAFLFFRRIKGVFGMPVALALFPAVYAAAGSAVSIAYLCMLVCITLQKGVRVKDLFVLLGTAVAGISVIGIAWWACLIPNPLSEAVSAITSTHYAIFFLPGIVLFYYAFVLVGWVLVQEYLAGPRLFQGWLPALCGYAAMIGVGSAGAFFSFDPAVQRCLRFDHYAQAGEWKSIVNEEKTLSANGTADDEYFLYRSLYHERIPFSETVAPSGPAAMIFDFGKDACLFSAVFNSDLFFQMGATNQSIRWAWEAVNSYGCLSPRLLKRLTLCYAAQGRIEMARSLLAILDNTITGRRWALSFAPVLDDSLLLAEDDDIKRLRMLEPMKAYISWTNIPSYEFRQIWLQSRTFNNMAFQYSHFLIPQLLSDYDNFCGFVAKCQSGDNNSCLEMEKEYANTRLLYDYANIRKSPGQAR